MALALMPLFLVSTISSTASAGPVCADSCQPPRHAGPVCVGSGSGITCAPATGAGSQGIVAQAAIRTGRYVVEGSDDLGQRYCCSFPQRPDSIVVLGADHECGNDFVDLSWPNFSDYCEVHTFGGEDSIFSLTEIDAMGAKCKVLGGPDDDYIYMAVAGEAFGNDGDDTIEGGDYGFLGVGGFGDDTLRGSSGEDTLLGESGRDFIHGFEGDDLLDGGQDDDLIRGGAGEDRLQGQSGWDTMFGGPGHDTFHGASGNDLMEGGKGSDRMWGGSDDDCIFGDDNTTEGIGLSEGGDIVAGERGNDYMEGGPGPNDQALDLFGNNICFAEVKDCLVPTDPLNAGPDDCGQRSADVAQVEPIDVSCMDVEWLQPRASHR